MCELRKRDIYVCIQLQLVFRRHAHDRAISFATIASGAKVDINEVCEHYSVSMLQREPA